MLHFKILKELDNNIFQSGDGEEEGWYLHNAMKAEDGIIYHPECFKDRTQALDNSADADTTMDADTTAEKSSMETTIDVVTKQMETTLDVVTKQEPTAIDEESKPSDTSLNDVNIKKEESDVENVQSESNNGEVSVKLEGAIEDSSPDPSNEIPPESMESEVKTEELSDEAQEDAKQESDGCVSHTSLVTDDNMQLAAPIMPQPKVVVTIWMKGSILGPSSVILYSVQKYILGLLPLSLRGYCDYLNIWLKSLIDAQL